MKGGEEAGKEKDRQKLCSLSKSRKKFGPCSSSVQVSTFNRFPIWFLQERNKDREGKKRMCDVKKPSTSMEGVGETADQS